MVRDSSYHRARGQDNNKVYRDNMEIRYKEYEKQKIDSMRNQLINNKSNYPKYQYLIGFIITLCIISIIVLIILVSSDIISWGYIILGLVGALVFYYFSKNIIIKKLKIKELIQNHKMDPTLLYYYNDNDDWYIHWYENVLPALQGLPDQKIVNKFLYKLLL